MKTGPSVKEVPYEALHFHLMGRWYSTERYLRAVLLRSYCGSRRPSTLPMRESPIHTPHKEATVTTMSAMWRWAGCVSPGQGPEELSTVRSPHPHLLIKRTLVCGRVLQTGKGPENKARALLGAMTGISLNFSHRNKLGEINLIITFDQIYVQRIRLCTTFSVYTGFSA